MTSEQLERLVISEYNKMCFSEDLKKIMEIHSLEIRCLIKVIAPMLTNVFTIKNYCKRFRNKLAEEADLSDHNEQVVIVDHTTCKHEILLKGHCYLCDRQQVSDTI